MSGAAVPRAQPGGTAGGRQTRTQDEASLALTCLERSAGRPAPNVLEQQAPALSAGSLAGSRTFCPPRESPCLPSSLCTQQPTAQAECPKQASSQVNHEWVGTRPSCSPGRRPGWSGRPGEPGPRHACQCPAAAAANHHMLGGFTSVYSQVLDARSLKPR